MSRTALVRISFGALLVVSAAAFGVRLWFVLISGPYAATTGFEEFCHYNIWKVAHGFPLYESPVKAPYLLTSYNAGFYEVYAGWAQSFGALGTQLVACTRLLTMLFAAAACALQVRLVRLLVEPSKWSAGWAWGLGFLFWFGSTFSPWTPLTTRPDAAAVTFAIAGLLAALRGNESGRACPWLFASGLFFLAWSFKQSVVWIYAGVMLYLLVAGRRWKPLLLIGAPFAALAAAVIWAGGATYRYNVFVVPGIYRWFALQSGVLLARLVALNLFFWVIGIAAIYTSLRASLENLCDNSDHPHVGRRRMLAVVALPPLFFGIVQLALHGSNVNNIIEAAALITALATAWWIEKWRDDASRQAIGVALMISMLPLPCVHVVQAARGIPETEIRRVSTGNAIKLNQAQLARRRAFAQWMTTLPKPVWIHDAMLELPWFSNHSRYPAFPFDQQFQVDAGSKRLLDGGGFFSLIRHRYFAALILRPGFDVAWIRDAQRAGYVEAALPAEFSSLATEYGLERPVPRLFLRP